MEVLASSLRLLADPTRLRILRLLAREELNAGELAAILGLGQPAVSRQLGLLREARVLAERREGRYVFFSLAPGARAVDGSWGWVLGQLDAADDAAGDLARLDDVLRTRRERQLRGRDATGTEFVPGRSWRAWSRALAWLAPPGLRVVDLGCGDGALSLEIARFAGEVVGVDPRPKLLQTARALARERGAAHARFQRGEITASGLPDGAFDLVVLTQTFHRVDRPAEALAEAARLLAPGGRVVMLVLCPHQEDWVRDRLGHQQLGLHPVRLTELLEAAGFTRVHGERMPARAGDPFKVVIAGGVR